MQGLPLEAVVLFGFRVWAAPGVQALLGSLACMTVIVRFREGFGSWLRVLRVVGLGSIGI